MTSRVQDELIDRLLEAYVEWREESIALADAYERWRTVSDADRGLAFAAYRAALDREQQASVVYAQRSDEVEREVSSVEAAA